MSVLTRLSKPRQNGFPATFSRGLFEENLELLQPRCSNSCCRVENSKCSLHLWPPWKEGEEPSNQNRWELWGLHPPTVKDAGADLNVVLRSGVRAKPLILSTSQPVNFSKFKNSQVDMIFWHPRIKNVLRFPIHTNVKPQIPESSRQFSVLHRSPTVLESWWKSCRRYHWLQRFSVGGGPIQNIWVWWWWWWWSWSWSIQKIRSIANSEEHSNFVDPFRPETGEIFVRIVHIFLSLESKLSMIFEASQRFRIPGGFHVDSHGTITLDLSRPHWWLVGSHNLPRFQSGYMILVKSNPTFLGISQHWRKIFAHPRLQVKRSWNDERLDLFLLKIPGHGVWSSCFEDHPTT